MRILALFFFSLASLATARQKVEIEKVVRYRETVSGNRIEVTIHQREFDFSGYKLSGEEDGDGKPAKINGVEIAGTDGQSPRKRSKGWPRIETIAEIELKWNGKRIAVPRLLHINLLNLSLRSDSIQFVPRPNGKELLIQAHGGDGGGSYLVSLVLRKNGNHKQYECGYDEGGLRPFPYEIQEATGEEDEGRTIIKSFFWLKAKPKQGGGDKPSKPDDNP